MGTFPFQYHLVVSCISKLLVLLGFIFFPSNAATVSYFKFIFCKITFIQKMLSAAVASSASCIFLPLFSHMPLGSVICLVLDKITWITNCFFLSSTGCKNGEVVERNEVLNAWNCCTRSGYARFLAHTFCKMP